MREQERI